MVPALAMLSTREPTKARLGVELGGLPRARPDTWRVSGVVGPGSGGQSVPGEHTHRPARERKVSRVLRNKTPLGDRGQIQEGQALLHDYAEEFSVKAVGSDYYPSSGGIQNIQPADNASPSQSEGTTT